MFKTFAAFFCITTLASTTAWAGYGRAGDVGLTSTDVVISSVDCVVLDPGRLQADLGFESGQHLLVETLNDKFSSIFVDGEPLMTAFPAVLVFDDSGFELKGREPHADGEAWLSLRVKGRLMAPPCAGRMKMEYIDSASDYHALVKLGACQRVR
jgi:hypothetical protein